MSRAVWDGKGEMPRDAVHFTTRDGILRGREYVRERAAKYLGRWRTTHSASERASAIRATVDNDEWMSQRNGMLVEAVVRDVEVHLLRGE